MYEKMKYLLILIIAVFASCNSNHKKQDNLDKLSWNEIEQQAKGKSVTMLMYVGSKGLNRYINEFVIPSLKQRYSITMNVVNGQGKDIVSNIMSEKEAGN